MNAVGIDLAATPTSTTHSVEAGGLGAWGTPHSTAAAEKRRRAVRGVAKTTTEALRWQEHGTGSDEDEGRHERRSGRPRRQ